MASQVLLDLEDAGSSPRSSHSPGTFTHPLSSTAIELKALDSSTEAKCGCEAPLHSSRLFLGLHVPKQYLIIAQRADTDGADVYLRFPISLGNTIYTVYYEGGRTTLVLEVRSPVQHEVVYSGQTGSQFERELERETVQATCSLSTTVFEAGTKLVMNAKAKENEENFHLIIQTMASVVDGENRGRHFDDSSRRADSQHDLNDLVTPSLTDAASLNDELVDAPEDLQHQTQLDIWEGLKQLDSEDTKKRAISLEVSNSRVATADASKASDLIGLGIDFGYAPPPVQPSSVGSVVSGPLAPADEQVDSVGSTSGEFSFPSTQEISTIQSLPSAAFPQIQPPAVYQLVERVAPGSLRGHMAEQQLQQQWNTVTGQWSSAHKAPKYANIKTNYASSPRAGEDGNQVRGATQGPLGEADRGKNKENATPAAGRSEMAGWGHGTFGQQRGRGGRAESGGGRGRGSRRGMRGRERGWGRVVANREPVDRIKSFRGSWGDGEEHKVW